MLGKSKRSLQRYRSEGSLPYVMYKHSTHYRESDVENFKKVLIAEFEERKRQQQSTKNDATYVKFNSELGRPRYYRNNPDVAQSVTPSHESTTQVAVNSEGKSNEATRYQREPLERGQTTPRTAQQQNPHKRKGMGI